MPEIAYREQRERRGLVGRLALGAFVVFNLGMAGEVSRLIMAADELASRSEGLSLLVVKSMTGAAMIERLACWAVGGVLLGLMVLATRPARRWVPIEQPSSHQSVRALPVGAILLGVGTAAAFAAGYFLMIEHLKIKSTAGYAYSGAGQRNDVPMVRREVGASGWLCRSADKVQRARRGVEGCEPLAPGLTVVVHTLGAEFSRVSLPNGSVGWIKTSNLAP